MTTQKKELHPRNKNRERYDLSALVKCTPKLKDYIKPNKNGGESIDFPNPIATKLLNKALLKHYYGIKYWEFPEDNLCPTVPGRAEYIHHIADLLAETNSGKAPTGDKVTCLDVGVGASCIYPIIGVTEYGWYFIGSEFNYDSIDSAENIIDSNPSLKGKVELRLQKNPKNIFHGILTENDQIDVVICNPPFHSSLEEAQKVTQRKVKNLTGKRVTITTVNLAGSLNELIYDGGEYQFIKTMIKESKQFTRSCFWFTSLVSKESNLKAIEKLLKNAGAKQTRIIPLGTGNKNSRIVAWTFFGEDEQDKWKYY